MSNDRAPDKVEILASILGGGRVPVAPWTSYFLALAFFGIALAARFALLPVEMGLAFLTFYPAVALSALLLGTGPCLLTVALGAVAGPYIFISPFWVFKLSHDSLLSAVIFSSSGVIVCFLTHKMRHHVEQFRESEARFRTLFEGVPVGQMLVEPGSLRVLQCNREASDVIGYSREELCRLRVWDFNIGLNSETAQSIQQRLFANERVQFESQYRQKNGELRRVFVTIVMLRTSKGNRFHSTLLDIPDRKRAEADLRIAATAFELQESMMITDAKSVILQVNKAFTRNTGYTADEAVGQTPRLLKSGRHDADFYREMWKTIHRTGTWQGEIWDRRKNGQVYPQWLTISAVVGGDGAVVNYIGTHYDITEIKNAESAMLNLNRDLSESRQRLRELAAQNEAKREGERKHIAQEVHDELGQVLTALRMDISLLGMRFGSLDPAVIDKVQDMKGLVDRAILGVRNVAVNLRPTALDMGLVPAIEWLCKEFTRQTAIACVFEAGGENIDLDETRAVVIFRIVQESLTNVTRYAQASQVEITLGLRGHELGLEVRDNGLGFDLAAAAKRKSFGLLGMRERALALGGHVDIISVLGQGTVIGLSIPIDFDTAKENS